MRSLACAALLTLVLAASAQAAGPAGAQWQKVAPASVGLDAAKLAQIAALAKRGHSNCLVVVRHGKLAGEWYFRGTGPNTTQDVYSATKSFVSTLVGIAQDDGDLRIGDRASKWIEPWRGTPSQAVTVRDLLSMDSGREWNVVTDYLSLLGAPDRTAFAIGLGQDAAPGVEWAYNNSAVQTLDRVLQKATGQDVADVRPHAHLRAARHGAHDDGDRQGGQRAAVRGHPLDLPRHGALRRPHARQGALARQADRVVRAGSHRPPARSSSKLNAAYGYLWWLNRHGVIASVTAATTLQAIAQGRTDVGRMVAGAPGSMYWALGLGDQLIQIDPASQTVVVRLGPVVPIPASPSFGPAEASRVVTEAVRGR